MFHSFSPLISLINGPFNKATNSNTITKYCRHQKLVVGNWQQLGKVPKKFTKEGDRAGVATSKLHRTKTNLIYTALSVVSSRRRPFDAKPNRYLIRGTRYRKLVQSATTTVAAAATAATDTVEKGSKALPPNGTVLKVSVVLCLVGRGTNETSSSCSSGGA